MKRDNLINQSLLLELLFYESDSGRLIWKKRNVKYFSSLNECVVWNNRYAGKDAGGLDKRGGITLKIFDKSMSAARIAYLYHYGTIPDKKMTYKNKNKTDLRIDNLIFL